MVEEHLPLVWHVAGKLVRLTPLPYRELVSAGMVGLVEAARRYDPGRGTAFSTFAVPRIRGAMLDEVRASIPLARSERTIELVPWDQYHGATTDTAEEEAIRAEQMETAQRLLGELPERDRDIVLSWAWGEKGVSIARRHSITGGRVTQIRQQALARLREKAA